VISMENFAASNLVSTVKSIGHTREGHLAIWTPATAPHTQFQKNSRGERRGNPGSRGAASRTRRPAGGRAGRSRHFRFRPQMKSPAAGAGRLSALVRFRVRGLAGERGGGLG
jgi:hypothetical protein